MVDRRATVLQQSLASFIVGRSTTCCIADVLRCPILLSSGLLLGSCYLVEGMMVKICWATSNVEGFMKFMKFVELAASNMLAITNLAICVNLALIVWVSEDQSETADIQTTMNGLQRERSPSYHTQAAFHGF